MNSFVIADPNNCIGCRTCEVACVQAHLSGNGQVALSPATFQPRLKVIKTAKVSTPVQCRHCEDAPCVNVCPSGAIIYTQNSVQVLQERCLGCKSCMIACPYGAMAIVTVKAEGTRKGTKVEAQKCDLCITREDGPACVSLCPTKALQLVDRSALEEKTRVRQNAAALAAQDL